MRWLSKRRGRAIRVNVTVRSFIEGRMIRVSKMTEARDGDRLKDLLKQLRREGALEASVVRYILGGPPGVTVLQNGARRDMPEAREARLADGDELSILTPMAGG